MSKFSSSKMSKIFYIFKNSLEPLQIIFQTEFALQDLCDPQDFFGPYRKSVALVHKSIAIPIPQLSIKNTMQSQEPCTFPQEPFGFVRNFR